MLCCFVVCLSIAIYLHMIPEFIVFTGIFMLLRTYAGGVHLNSFGGCFICSVVVQTVSLFIGNKYQFSVGNAWSIILISAVLIWKFAPVESISRELDRDEMEHCKKVTLKIIIGILSFAGVCTFVSNSEIVSLIALTVMVVFVSQCIGIIKYKVEKRFVEK